MPSVRHLVATAIAALSVVALSGCQLADRALNVGAGFTAHVLCSLVFHSGIDAEHGFDDYIVPVIGPAAHFIMYEVDTAGQSVEASGLYADARAIFREGEGCTLVSPEDELRLTGEPPSESARSWNTRAWPSAEQWLSAEAKAELAVVVNGAFDEPEGPGRLRQTTAVVAVKRGQLLIERYAKGIDRSTPLMSWSMAKSVTATLVGIGVREGRFELEAPAPVPEWRDTDDPRGALAIDHLLRMSSGLEFDEHYGAINDVSVMLFTKPDTGAFAAAKPLAHPVDTMWSYSSGTSNILARILRHQFVTRTEMIRWSREQLFDRIGMTSAVFETDASGSFIGSSFAFATARDWARLGQLHLQDGVWGGERILPQGWVDYVRTPTPAAARGGYGAHWWLNAGSPGAPEDRVWPSLPGDAYAARGMSGQYVVVVPSAELVVVRLGLSQAEGDALHGIEALVAGIIAASKDQDIPHAAF